MEKTDGILIPATDLKLQHPCVIQVIGPSMSGKTELVLQIIRRRDEIFSVKIDQIIFVYSEFQPSFDAIAKEIPIILFTNKLEVLDEKIQNRDIKSIVILDDLMEAHSKDTSYFNELYTKKTHHFNLALISIIHNPYYKNNRTQSLNTTYLVLYKLIRCGDTLSMLSRQLFPQDKQFFLQSYYESISQKYGYLFVDLQSYTNDLLRLRNSVFPDLGTKVFVKNGGPAIA